MTKNNAPAKVFGPFETEELRLEFARTKFGLPMGEELARVSNDFLVKHPIGDYSIQKSELILS